jgi:hypothetical protein
MALARPARSNLTDEAKSVVTIRPGISVREVGKSALLRVPDDRIHFPDRCSVCLSPEVSATREIGGKMTVQGPPSADAILMPILAFRVDQRLMFNAKVPYCQECNQLEQRRQGNLIALIQAGRGSSSVRVLKFNMNEIVLGFTNPDYAKLFVEENSSIVKQEDGGKTLQGIAAEGIRCPKCGEVNPPNLYRCRICGEYIRKHG